MEPSMILAGATIVAIFLGPIVALRMQRISESRRNRRNRKRFIFQELMATRASRVSPRHVDALNAIEVEFSGAEASDPKVLDAWRLYLDHLNTPDVDDIMRWGERGDDLLIDLLYEMSQALRYRFDKVALKRHIYSPKAHGLLENDQHLLRKYLVEMMEGKRPISIRAHGEEPHA